jgi:hypothetical protein
MTTYKEIFGKYVKNYSSDPTADAEGQVWYNTTSGTFKSVVSSGTWSSASPLITARRGLGGAGTQTSGLAFGGNTFVPSSNFNATEEYNGSGWSNGGNMGTARRFLGICRYSNRRTWSWWLYNNIFKCNRRIRWLSLGFRWKFRNS